MLSLPSFLFCINTAASLLSHSAVRLSLSDSLGVNNAEVAHVVLHAALVQSFQSGYLLLLHGHNELSTQKHADEHGEKHGAETHRKTEQLNMKT